MREALGFLLFWLVVSFAIAPESTARMWVSVYTIVKEGIK